MDETSADHTVDGGSRTEAAALIGHVSAELTARMAGQIPAGLHLVATPIGNLADITLRALVVLAKADHVFCEDTRQSLKILQRYGIRQRLSTYHEHNADRMRPHLMKLLGEGRSVALMSDAGTPLISDPGFKLVREAAAAGIAVHALPGASAVLAGLTVSGLPTDAFHFAGFLPNRAVARRARIAELSAVPATLVLFETGQRIADVLDDLAQVLGPRPAAIARELTKLNETISRGSLDELALEMKGLSPKGEIVLLIGAGAPREATDDDIVAALTPELAAGSVKDAAARVAERLVVSRSRVYDLAIALKSGKLQTSAAPRTSPSDDPETDDEREG